MLSGGSCFTSGIVFLSLIPKVLVALKDWGGANLHGQESQELIYLEEE